MKVKILRILKSIVFCILVLAMLNYITQLFTPKWLENRWASAKTNKTFYDIKENTLDVGFYGSSVVAASIDPYQLYKEQGISAYNFGVMSQSMMGTYFWVKESLKTQSPKVVCVEVKGAGRKSDKDEVKARKSYDHMEWGFNKLKYAYEYAKCFPESDIYEYLFPLSIYHDRWRELEYDDYDFMAGNYISHTRGLATLTTYCTDTDPDYAGTEGIELDKSKKGSGYNKTNDAYLKRIIRECQRDGIKVILFKTPDPRWSTKQHNHIASLAAKFKDVEYLDLSTRKWFEENDFVYATDGCDYFHVNLLGAKKVTEYLGKYIKKTTDVPDRRKDPVVSKIFDKELKIYENVYDDALMCFEKNPTDYLKKINKDRYTVLISSGKDIRSHFSEEQKTELKELGMKDSFFETNENAYNVIAVLGKNQKYYKREKITEEKPQIELQDKFKNEIVYKITSGKKVSNITVAEHDYTINPEALNIVVYDQNTKTVADSVSLNVDASGDIVLSR